jgi:hypothetical protein
LLEQLDALGIPEVAIPVKQLDSDLGGVGDFVATLVAVILKTDGALRVILTEE